jgi:Cell division protein CrgA
MAKPTKRRVQGGRTTPKGGPTRPPKVAEPVASARYTPPIPREVKISPVWVPILMFVFLGVGTLVILVNYTGAVWDTSNWVLLGGLGAILAGIVTATQYH